MDSPLDAKEFRDFWPLVSQHPAIKIECAPSVAVASIVQLRVALTLNVVPRDFRLAAETIARQLQSQFCAPVSLLIDRLVEQGRGPVVSAPAPPFAAAVKPPTTRDVARLIALLLLALFGRWAAVWGCRGLARWLLGRCDTLVKGLPGVHVMELSNAPR